MAEYKIDSTFKHPNYEFYLQSEKLTDQDTYYCYAPNVISGCMFDSNEKLDLWKESDFKNACPQFDNKTNNFIEQSQIITKGCFNKNDWSFNAVKCSSLEYKDDFWSVDSFVSQMSSAYLYSENCNGSIAAPIPVSDNESRLVGINSTYYVMLIVPIFSFVISIVLLVMDRKVFKKEKKDPSNSNVIKNMIFGVRDAFIAVNIDVASLTIMCVCFYVGIFTYMSQLVRFLEDYAKLEGGQVTFCSSLLYALALPLNPLIGVILAKTQNEILFLFMGFVQSGFF